MSATTVSLVLKERVKLGADGKAAETRNTQVAGTYFNNDNATSVAMDVFKGVLDEAGKASTDKDLEEYGGLNDEEFLCEYVTKEADADGFLTRVRTEAHAVGDVDPDEDEEGEEDFDDEDEEGEFGEGAPAAYPPASEDDGEDDFGDAGAPAGDDQGDDEGEEEEEEDEAAQPAQKRKKM